MRRVDLLKQQLQSSRGRFFTATYKTNVGPMLTLNFKVKEIMSVKANQIKANVYIPSIMNTRVLVFDIGKSGDLQYLAADRSKISMSGKGLL
tara:strand:- start:25 stop:300 length:276 start_codon:yes stop_codon:yes gene_type:complete